MASADDGHHRPSRPEPASSGPSPSPSGPSRLSVHAALGGGAVADVLLWKRRNTSALMAAAATAVWFLLEPAGYSFLSVATDALLLVVVILFFWAKSASLLNRPLPPLPNLEISDEVVENVADKARLWINWILAIVQAIAITRDRKVFVQVILVLWLISYIGSLFSFLTVVYIGFLLCLSIPALYDKYQDRFDEKLGVAHNLVLKQYNNIFSSTTQSTKVKKTQ